MSGWPETDLYGVCSKCGGAYQVRKDGNLRSHTNRDSRATGLPFSSHCDGSGGIPAHTFDWPKP